MQNERTAPTSLPELTASVIIPCRNAAGTIAAAVRSALAQSPAPLEVLVIDDESTDDSGAIAATSGARVIRCERRRNAGGARNLGIGEARGDLIAFLDADVEIGAHWLARAIEVFRSDASVVAVGGRIVNGRPGRFGDLDLYLNHSEWISTSARSCTTFPTMAVVYRRDAVGPVRFPETNYGEDTFFAHAVRARGGRIWFDPAIRIVHMHERLDAESFWARQIDAGRQIYLTRQALELPGKVLYHAPVLLALYPHLWIVLHRMLRRRMVVKALTLFPWLAAGETARIIGFLRARRESRRDIVMRPEGV
jgi:glycosyltransferase involved in cell wall biosynthesis